MLTRKRVVAAKLEGVEGVAEAITVADAGIIATDITWAPDIKFTNIPVQLATMSNLAPTIGARGGRVSFKAPLKGSGGVSYATAGPALAPYLKACYFAETLAAASAIYKPASTGPTITLWVYEDGLVKKLKGCRGNVKFMGKNGEPNWAVFDFMGVYDAVVDLALIAPTLEGTVAPALLNAAFTIDAYAAIVDGFEIDMANQLELDPSINAAAGYISTAITSRLPTVKLSPKQTTVATYDWNGKLLSGAQVAMNIGPLGSGTCNKVQLAAPKVVYTAVGEGSRAGNVTNEVTGQLCLNTGDDELVLTFAQ